MSQRCIPDSEAWVKKNQELDIRERETENWGLDDEN